MISSSVEPLPIEGTYINYVEALPTHIPDSTRFGPYLQTAPGDALFDYPDIGRFRVRDGKLIEIEVPAGCAKERAASFARMAPFGCLVHQRGELPLHASSVVRPDGKVLLIAGASGTGKSTTAAAFAQRGWKVLNDDMSRLTVSEAGVRVWPGFSSLKLWDQTCRLLNIDRSPLRATGELKEKYFWSSDPAQGSHLVSVVVELDADGGGLQKLSGSAAVRMLLRQTFRPRLVRALGLKDLYFTQVLRAATLVSCFRFSNNHILPPAAVAERIEKAL